MNIWLKILQWFQDRNERNALILDFNQHAKDAFVAGVMPVLMEASVSRGVSEYKHAYSHWWASGFRIRAYAGKQLSRNEIISIGEVIIGNDILVRRLVVLGFDTLEIHCDVGNYGCRWQLKDYLALDYTNMFKSIQ